MTWVGLAGNRLTVFEEGVFKEMLQQMVSIQPPIGSVRIDISIFPNTFVTCIIKCISLSFSNWIQIRSPAVATSPGSFETIVISFRSFDMGYVASTVRFHPSLSRSWILIPLPNVRKPETSGTNCFLSFSYWKSEIFSVILLVAIQSERKRWSFSSWCSCL